jgi:hypothetical protein
VDDGPTPEEMVAAFPVTAENVVPSLRTMEQSLGRIPPATYRRFYDKWLFQQHKTRAALMVDHFRRRKEKPSENEVRNSTLSTTLMQGRLLHIPCCLK